MGPSKIIREATRRRIRAERAELRGLSEPLRSPLSQFDYNRHRLEEGQAITMLAKVPSVFFFAEQYAKELGLKYNRPGWASHRYGAK